MKLSELKNGAIIETRNGLRYVKIDNTFFEIDTENIGGFISVDSYNEEMLCVSRHADTGKSIKKFGESIAFLGERDRFWDIVKVNNDVVSVLGYLNNAIRRVVCFDDWTWVRPKPILDDEEKDYLSKICKPYEIIYIGKEEVGNLERIVITVKSKYNKNETIPLPLFEPNTMYKGMELYCEYTPKALGL